MQEGYEYDDIIRLPHHVSADRPRMSRLGRAAQFSPFAALTGYEDQITETARLTDQPVELTEQEQDLLDRKLQQLAETLPEGPLVEITHFVPDGRKTGGAFVTACGRVKRLDADRRVLVMENGEQIQVDTICGIEPC